MDIRYSLAKNLGVGMCAVTLGAALIAPAVSARAQEQAREPSLTQRTEQLQRDFRALERAVPAPGAELSQTTGMPATNAAMARIDVRLGNIENDMRTLTGRVEQLGYDMRQLGERVDKVVSDMEFRLRRLEQQAGIATGLPEDAPAAAEPSLRQPAPMLGGSPAGSHGSAAGTAGGVRAGSGPESGPGVLATVPRSELDAETEGLRSANPQPPPQPPPQAAPQSPPQSPSPSSPGGPAGGSPQEQYAYAFSLLQAARYDEAEQALEAFLLQNSDHMLADNARYWLGETFYVRGQYPEAAQQFVDAYQKNRSGAKSGDALLKLGMSLSQLGKTDEACATFRELSRTQPDAPETVKNKAAQEAQRTGCS